MKNIICSLIAIIAFCSIQSINAAEADNGIYAGNVTGKQGESIVLPIFMTNSVRMCSVQFDIILPEGVSVGYTTNRVGTKIYAVSLGIDRFEDLDHTITLTQQTDGAYRFVINSNTNASIWDEDATGHDIRATSPLVNVKLLIAEDVQTGVNNVVVENVTMASYDATNKKINKYIGIGQLSPITITEKAEPEPCATPVITIVDGKLLFSCETEGAAFHYTISSADISEGEHASTGEVSLTNGVLVIVYAIAEGYLQSEKATKTLPLSFGKSGDLNGDGSITVGDVTKLADKAMKEKDN